VTHQKMQHDRDPTEQRSLPPEPPVTLRRRLYEIMELGHGEDRTSRQFDTALVILIVLNIAAFVAESVPSLHAAYAREFAAFEYASVAVFSLEYLTRLWVSVEVPYLRRLSPWQARWRFAKSPAQVIDLLAVLPFYLGQFFAIDLRMLRALRLLRLLKLSRYSPAMHTLIRVISNERRALSGALLLLSAAVLFASTGMHYLESDAQPEKFGSIPDAAWWAVATLTTVGYGDVTPVTPIGKLFGGVVMVVGLCILALPVAIISTGFAQEVNRRDFVVNWSLMSKIPLLAELEARDAALVMPLFHAHNFPPNVEVIGQGVPNTAIFFIAAGHVRRRSSSGEHSYKSGEVFGGLGALSHGLHSSTYVTAGRCRLLKLYQEDFKRLEMAAPDVAGRIRAAVARHHIIETRQDAEPDSQSV